MSKRTFIVGDVHGCIRELDALLAEAGSQPGDEWIFVGDLVGKGEASSEVLDRFIAIGARGAVGNHELKWLEARRVGDFSRLSPPDREAAIGLQDHHWAALEAMLPWIELPDANSLVVHGGFHPAMPWRKQTSDMVTTIQVIDADGQARMRKDCPHGTPWAEFWNGPEFVVYGHTPRREVAVHPHAIGIDTGCVHGGFLTAMVLPERRRIQIPARRVYAKADF